MKIKLSTLKLNPNNPRQIKGERLAILKKSITDFEKMLELRPIIIDENNIVLGGNMRLQALKGLGYKDIPERWVKQAKGLTEDEKKQFIIKDNVGFGEWDFEILAKEWDYDELKEWGFDSFDGIPDLDIGAEDEPVDKDSKDTDLIKCPKCGFEWK